MEPTYTCPPGHRLDNKMCVVPPTLSCPTGHELINGMCQQIANVSMSPLPEIPMSPELNMMTMSAPMMETDQSPMVPMMMESSPSPMMPMMETDQSPMSPMMESSQSPMMPMMGSNCPTGYQFSSIDNMCYPLKI